MRCQLFLEISRLSLGARTIVCRGEPVCSPKSKTSDEHEVRPYAFLGRTSSISLKSPALTGIMVTKAAATKFSQPSLTA